MKVPRKNISPKIADIQTPKKINAELSGDDLEKSELETDQFLEKQRLAIKTSKKGSPRPPRRFGKIFFIILFSAIIFGGFLFFNYYQSRAKIIQSFNGSWQRFESFLNPSSAGNQTEQKLPNFNVDQLWSSLRAAGAIYRNLQTFSAISPDLIQEVSFLEANGLNLFFNRGGDALIANLRKIKNDLELISGTTQDMPISFNFLPIASSDFLSLKLNLQRWTNFLGALTDWLESPGEHHLLVLFQNPSEIRPAGGFLGSYADLIVKDGSFEKIDVHDINDVDRELDTKIIPPKPLQALVSNWRTADANWFFDFPTSAEKVGGFMETSKIYKTESVSFDGVLALSPKVVSDILSLTGPLEISDKHLLLNKDNFLTEIQKQVQISQNQKATYPKKILEELAPTIIQKLSLLDDSGKRALLELAADWFAKKDLMVYFKNPSSLNDLLDFYDAGGRIFELPQNFNGDYLAVVNANIGGGKTDLYVRQKIVFESQLNADGTASDNLTISRRHQGDESPYWWYRLPNIDYLQVFTAPNVEFSNFNGGWDRKIYPPINYKKSGFQSDSLVSKVESSEKNYFGYPALKSFQESGKNIFASWIRTNLGQESKISLYYKNKLFLPVTEGMMYQFIFEKQAGSSADYDFAISAPVGFKWKENNLPVFEYQTSDPAGRLIFNLTLERI